MSKNETETPRSLALVGEIVGRLKGSTQPWRAGRESRVDRWSRPQRNALNWRTKDADNLALNVKLFGYELARQLADALPLRTNLAATHVGVTCKPSTQRDIASDWVAFWCSELKIRLSSIASSGSSLMFCKPFMKMVIYIQVSPGRRGLGFGCGEGLCPVCCAARGMAITMTDLPPSDRASSAGWVATGQHAASAERAFQPHLVGRAEFERNVSLRHVDMNKKFLEESPRYRFVAESRCARSNISARSRKASLS